MSTSNTQIGKLYIELQAKTTELERGLNIAKKKLQEIEAENKKVVQENKNVEGSYIAMSAIAVASLVKITGAIKSSIAEYNNYTQAISSLKDVADYSGESMSNLGNIMSEFSNYMTQSDLAATIKNFTLMGYSADDTRKMIEALTNSAIKNRNANYTVSQAVKVASDGYKQGLSTLSDSAGVTENLSVMLDNYAKSIGKTASQLTEAEKNQAYLNRTMVASEPFTGAMAEYMDTLAGKQGAYAQAMRETQVAYGEALAPSMKGLLEILTNVTNGINELIEANPSLVTGITTSTVAISVATIGMVAFKKAKDAYTKSTFAATVAQQGFNAALAANPAGAIMLVASALIGVVIGLADANRRAREEQDRLNESIKRGEEIKSGTYKYTDSNYQATVNETEAMKEQLEIRKLLEENEKERENLRVDTVWGPTISNEKKFEELTKERQELKKQLRESIKENQDYGASIDELNKKIEQNAEWIDNYNELQSVSTKLDTEAVRIKKKEASQLVINAKQNRDYLNTIKNGIKGTEEYEEAVKALSKAYPEAVSASGPLIDELDLLITKEETTANETYNSVQSMIQSYKDFFNTILSDETMLKQASEMLSLPVDELTEKINNALALYDVLYGKAAREMGGTTGEETSGSNAYQNKALDNYKKQIEYKKNLDKISAEEEIKMYEYALRNLAKTNDEKMDLEVDIYQLRKQLIEDFVEKEKTALQERTENSERWIEEQNLSAKELEEAYNRIIDYHKEYLDKMVADERLSLEQKETIWKEEINIIKDYQKQIRDIRVETANNVYEALKEALTKQADELQEIEETAANKSLESLENAKKKKIEMINEEYDARIKAIDDELKALENAEKEKTRLEEEANYEKQRKRLEELIAYEHDAVTKATYEKELAKLNSDYEKTLEKYALEDKKEALNNEKANLKDEQQAKIDSVTAKYESEKLYLDNRLVMIQENYDKERELADKNAQLMLLNAETYQNEIIALLKTYGDEYELLGTTWGERVVTAFEEKIKSIVTTVEKLNTQINSAIDNKLQTIASGSNDAYLANQKSYYSSNKSAIDKIANEKGVDIGVATDIHKTENKTGGTTIVQNNTFNVPAEKPSTLLQKTQKAFQSLGELVRGAV